ncbi:MAG: hypothetical protein R3304_04460 [Longimicrobiales bacterium]|nr:hypothetical protein [Longimicrobiales bacterium]
MSIVLAIGTAVGFVFGVVHAWGVYRQRLREAAGVGVSITPGLRLRSAYSALWTVGLWTLFGSYVLVLWLVSVPLWLGSRVARSGRLVTVEA